MVGDNSRTLRSAAAAAADDLGWRIVNLNVALATELSSHMPADRAAIAWDTLLSIVGDHAEGVVLIPTDVIWEPSLALDPYRALRRMGREGPVLAAWFGHVDGHAIMRAEPGHPEYSKNDLDVPYVAVQ
jgi:hypothetical protein